MNFKRNSIVFILGVLLSACSGSYRTADTTYSNVEIKKHKSEDKKALKQHLKKQKKRRKEVDQLNTIEPAENINKKKGAVPNPNTYY
jgi:hypothetical protein